LWLHLGGHRHRALGDLICSPGPASGEAEEQHQNQKSHGHLPLVSLFSIIRALHWQVSLFLQAMPLRLFFPYIFTGARVICSQYISIFTRLMPSTFVSVFSGENPKMPR
jgi:hypothetical protein